MGCLTTIRDATYSVHATVSIGSPNNTILKKNDVKYIHVLVAFHIFIRPDPFRIWTGILYSVYEGYLQIYKQNIYLQQRIKGSGTLSIPQCP